MVGVTDTATTTMVMLTLPLFLIPVTLPVLVFFDRGDDSRLLIQQLLLRRRLRLVPRRLLLLL